MKVVVAPDSFKGSISAISVCNVIRDAIHRISPDVKVDMVPMADGGEGTVEALLFANQGTVEKVEVHGPLMEKTTAQYGVFTLNEVRYAVIECAASTGLDLVPVDFRNPMKANSYGLGEQIKDALHKGYTNVIVTLGGSATNDGGIGMLQALGWEFFDKNGSVINPSSGNPLLHINDFSSENQMEELSNCRITIACDVNNPFYGENGAARVFAKQKGASDEEIQILDQRLEKFAKLLLNKRKINVQNIKGAGAAGGLGGALACLHANMISGVELITTLTNAEEKIKDADIVITGEGSLDHQSLMGKVPIGVAKLAKKYNKKVIGIAGRIDSDTTMLNQYIDAVFSIQTECLNLAEALNETTTKKQLKVTMEQIWRLVK